MAIAKELLEILICPACKGDGLKQIENGLKCDSCGRVYPVRDEIPIMLIEEALTT